MTVAFLIGGSLLDAFREVSLSRASVDWRHFHGEGTCVTAVGCLSRGFREVVSDFPSPPPNHHSLLLLQ
jgi:hypothetical protein